MSIASPVRPTNGAGARRQRSQRKRAAAPDKHAREARPGKGKRMSGKQFQKVEAALFWESALPATRLGRASRVFIFDDPRELDSDRSREGDIGRLGVGDGRRVRALQRGFRSLDRSWLG